MGHADVRVSPEVTMITPKGNTYPWVCGLYNGHPSPTRNERHVPEVPASSLKEPVFIVILDAQECLPARRESERVLVRSMSCHTIAQQSCYQDVCLFVCFTKQGFSV